MNNIILQNIISGPFWAIKSLLIIIFIALIFTCAPAVLINKEIHLPPAYALKAQHPFADTSQLTIPEHIGERSHGAKLTPRLVGSIFIWLTQKASLHPYIPATIFGFIYLISGLLVAYYVTEDKIIGFFTGIIFSGLYASSACFSINWMPKPFDGIAIGLIGATLISIQRPWLLPVWAFLSCWTDERALISLFFIVLFIIVWSKIDTKTKIKRSVLIAISVISYVITRMLLTIVMDWKNPDMSMIGVSPALAASFFQLAAWSAFEGGWIIIALAIRLLIIKKLYNWLALFLMNLALGFVSSLLVLDISRSGMFLFPLLLSSLAILKESGLNIKELRNITGVSALVTILAPNFEIIAGIAVKWLPSYFIYLLLK